MFFHKPNEWRVLSFEGCAIDTDGQNAGREATENESRAFHGRLDIKNAAKQKISNKDNGRKNHLWQKQECLLHNAA